MKLLRNTFFILASLGFLHGCATAPEKYNDTVYIVTENTVTHGEEASFEKHFLFYINRFTGDNLVGYRTKDGRSRYTMKIVILEHQKETGAGRVHRKTDDGSDTSREVTLYGYNIRIDLVDNEGGKLVWSWEPDKWKTYKSKEKAIRWLAKYSANKMNRAGLFGTRYITRY